MTMKRRHFLTTAAAGVAALAAPSAACAEHDKQTVTHNSNWLQNAARHPSLPYTRYVQICPVLKQRGLYLYLDREKIKTLGTDMQFRSYQTVAKSFRGQKAFANATQWRARSILACATDKAQWDSEQVIPFYGTLNDRVASDALDQIMEATCGAVWCQSDLKWVANPNTWTSISVPSSISAVSEYTLDAAGAYIIPDGDIIVLTRQGGLMHAPGNSPTMTTILLVCKDDMPFQPDLIHENLCAVMGVPASGLYLKGNVT